ncbi:glutathione S-transferase rho isoform X8 [Oncorhynchus keta]|nr:glutathione S-transferase rho isoform X4 [Oncorhynchus keta]XP_052325105.1 glutathione S-transferase rho isoform X5 [Oncorhynchus keta]XP_052325106.1 glutathione S-transferase rho isoform X6 [Oncorhynchus keta]XP_052325107.1 glutathione S-transferase rho isoform X7 [Oncorhynchus keta]XP_052325108.1 glutathione S-transferase rho isoform X8 [Oncorhynchus keta]
MYLEVRSGSLTSFTNRETYAACMYLEVRSGSLTSFTNRETYAACMYLESRFRSQGPQLIPEGQLEQALMYQRMFEVLNLSDKLSNVIYYNYRVPEGERHDSAIKRNKENLATEIKLWEGYFQKVEVGSYLSGKAFSLADVIVFPVIAYAFRFGLSTERYPRLGAYYDMVKDRPSVKATWPPHWLENPQGGDTLKEF